MIFKLLFSASSLALFLGACTPAPHGTTEPPPAPVSAAPPPVKPAPAPVAPPASKKEAPPRPEAARRNAPAPAKTAEAGKEGYAMTLVDSASLGNEISLTRDLLAGQKTARDSGEGKGSPPPSADDGANFVQGYRIQVYATTDFKDAERKKEDLTNSLSEKIYVVYESPFYKIRVGNFLKEEETKKLRKQLTEQGLDTWLVKCPIRKR